MLQWQIGPTRKTQDLITYLFKYVRIPQFIVFNHLHLPITGELFPLNMDPTFEGVVVKNLNFAFIQVIIQSPKCEIFHQNLFKTLFGHQVWWSTNTPNLTTLILIQSIFNIANILPKLHMASWNLTKSKWLKTKERMSRIVCILTLFHVVVLNFNCLKLTWKSTRGVISS